MSSAVLLIRVLPVAAAVTLSAAALATAGRPTGATQLPDLVQEVPSDLEITVTGPRARPVHRLGFRSAVSNIGRGPLIIAAVEPARTWQPHRRSGRGARRAPQGVVPNVGRLRYVVSGDHRHWHLLGFDRYQLRRAGRPEAATVDGSQDRLLPRRPLPGLGRRPRAAHREPVYTSRCGLGDPELSASRRGSPSATGTTTRPPSKASTCADRPGLGPIRAGTPRERGSPAARARTTTTTQPRS